MFQGLKKDNQSLHTKQDGSSECLSFLQTFVLAISMVLEEFYLLSSQYHKRRIATFQRRIAAFQRRIAALQRRIAALQRHIAAL